MRFFAPNLQAGETAVTTQAEYDHLFSQYQQAYADWVADFPVRDNTEEITQRKVAIEEAFRERRLPYVLIAICPFCGQEIWQKAMVFSLKDDFWYRTYTDGKDVHESSLCPHLFCVDGALNLNGHTPTEVTGAVFSPISGNRAIHMAAEVPFIKPRVLNLPTITAVLSNSHFVAFAWELRVPRILWTEPVRHSKLVSVSVMIKRQVQWLLEFMMGLENPPQQIFKSGRRSREQWLFSP